MASFAKLDDDNRVLNIEEVSDSDAATEAEGQTFLENIHGWAASKWKQFDYYTQNNQHKEGGTPFRGNAAIVGGYYHPSEDVFMPEKPHASWTLNTETAIWDPPVAYPTDTTYYISWDEANQKWLGTDDSSNNYEWDPSTSSWTSV